jgi:serine/threonine-protein kinase RsbW
MAAPHATTSPRRIELDLPSHPAQLAPVRKEIERFAAGHGFDERSVSEIGLVVNEAIANVIRHAYRGKQDRPVHVEAWVDDAGEQLTITLRDWGSGVDPSKLPAKQHDPLTPGGVGLLCLRQWMDNVTYTPQPGGGILTTMTRRKSR